jgi:hypothetical protein
MLFFRVARRLLPNALALVASGLFCSRLANTEALLYATQLQTTLPVFFALLALEVALGTKPTVKSLVGIASASALALLAKEQMVVIPAVVGITAVVHSRANGEPLWSRWRSAQTAVLFAVVGCWYVVAQRFLKVGDNPWWTYDFSPFALLRNYAAYALSYSNVLVSPVVTEAPVVYLDKYSHLMRAASAGAVVMLAAFVASAGGLVFGSFSGTRSAFKHYLVVACLGVGWFVLFLAPVVGFVNRRLVYYGYASSMGLSLALAALIGVGIEFARQRRGP